MSTGRAEPARTAAPARVGSQPIQVGTPPDTSAHRPTAADEALSVPKVAVIAFDVGLGRPETGDPPATWEFVPHFVPRHRSGP